MWGLIVSVNRWAQVDVFVLYCVQLAKNGYYLNMKVRRDDAREIYFSNNKF